MKVIVSRLTDRNIEFITFIIALSEFPLGMLCTSLMYANMYGISFALLFLAACIDFFRDKDSFVKASVMFFLLLNTHLISAIIGFICCVMICIYYFDKKEIIQYIRFALLTIGLCLYNIINVLYHSDILTSTKDINKTMLESNFVTYNTINNTYFGSFLLRRIIDTLGYGYTLCTYPILIITIGLFIKYRHKIFEHNKVKKIVYIVLGLIGLIISSDFIWTKIMSVVNIPIQFPIRYILFIEIMLLVLTFREICDIILVRVITVIQVITCVVSIFFVFTMEFGLAWVDNQVANGEYLDKSFVWDIDEFNKNKSQVIDQYGNTYTYDTDKQYLIVDLSSNTNTNTIIQVPKLYYKGYVAKTKASMLTDSFDVSMGYSQFINVNVDNYTGTLYVYYQHPLFLQILWGFTLVLLILIFLRCVYEKS
jgi:hypothetical protein